MNPYLERLKYEKAPAEYLTLPPQGHFGSNVSAPISEYIEQTDEEILSRAAELDALIHRLCALVGFDDAARDRMMAARKRMAASTLKAELQYFRAQVAKAEAGRYWR